MMTVQIHDSLIFENERYLVLNSENPYRLSFHAERFDMVPETRAVICRRGFYSRYRILDDYLYLTDVHLSLKKGAEYKKINGVLPKVKDKILGFRHYKDINLPVPYTGEICIGKDFLNEYYLRCGKEDIRFYKTVYLLYFVNGKLIQARDVSRDKEKQRENLNRKEVL